MRSWSRDALITLFCLGLIILAIWFLFFEQNQQREYEGEFPIGTIQKIKNVSQRFPGDRTISIRLEKKGEVYLYETIFVNPDADTILQIKLDKEYFLDEFTIDLNPGSNITFLPGGKVDVKGKAVVRNKTGDLMSEIEGNNKLSFSESEEGFKVEEIATENIAPVSVDLFTPSDSRLVSFQWEDLLPLTDKRIEISTDFDFKSIYLSQPVKDDVMTTSFALSSGKFFWRIKGKTSNRDTYGSVSVFQIYRYNPPRPYMPENGVLINYVTSLNETLKWRESSVNLGSESTTADGYIIEISQDSFFVEKKDYTLDVRTELKLSEKQIGKEGRYYWRVIPVFGEDNKWGKSDQLESLVGRTIYPGNFSVRKSDVRQSIKLIYPSQGLSLSSVDAELGVNYKWESDREAVKYKLQLSRSANFSQLIKDEEVNYNGWTDEEALDSGNYFWRVISLYEDGKEQYSAVSSFKVIEIEGGIEMISPPNRSLLRIGQSGDSTNFRWKSVGKNDGFRIHIFKGDSDIPFLSKDLKENSFEWVLEPENKYRWRVDVLNRLGRILQSSETGQFEIAGPMAPPFIVYPPAGEKIFLDGVDVLPLEWSEVIGADIYRVRLVNRRTNRVVIDNIETNRLKYDITNINQLESGVHTLSIQSIKKRTKGISTVSDPGVSAFEITNIVIYGKPRLLTPVYNETIDYHYQKRNGINFTWKQQPSMPKFIISVYEKKPGGPIVYQKEVTEQNLLIPSFPQGEYTWDVLPVDGGGNRKNRSDRGRFTIGQTGKLSGNPDLIYPQNGTTVAMDRKNEIVFSWSSVSGADYYIFKIYRKDTLESLVDFEKYSRTSYAFTALDKLSVGDYNIDVQAVRTNSDVGPGLEQKSDVITGTFTISLQKLPVPRVKSDDIQYTN